MQFNSNVNESNKLCHLASVVNLRFSCLYDIVNQFVESLAYHYTSKTRAVHTRAAECITADVREFENVL